MSNLALVVLCLTMGIILRMTRRIPETAAPVINGIVIHVSLPAATLLYMRGLQFNAELLHPVLMAWILFLLGAGFFWAIGRALNWNTRTIGALALTGAISNTSFVGFPLLLALYGPHALQIGILTDQPGSFLVLSTLGLLTASLCATGEFNPNQIWRRIRSFPPLYALIIAAALSSYSYPAWGIEILEKLSATLIPLSLLSVGFQLKIDLDQVREAIPRLAVGLGYKLLLGPALIAFLFVGVFGARGEALQITIVQAAMAPMITGAIVANEYELDPPLANLMIGVGIPLSLISVPIWAFLLRNV